MPALQGLLFGGKAATSGTSYRDQDQVSTELTTYCRFMDIYVQYSVKKGHLRWILTKYSSAKNNRNALAALQKAQLCPGT